MIAKAKVTIGQDENKPVEVKVLAKAIIDISAAFKALDKSGLNRRAIVALIHDKSKIGKSTIEIILNNLIDLENDYCKPGTK